jgi:hypothetical protein
MKTEHLDMNRPTDEKVMQPRKGAAMKRIIVRALRIFSWYTWLAIIAGITIGICSS